MQSKLSPWHLASSLCCLVWLAVSASAQIQLDRPRNTEPLPTPYTVGLSRAQILETVRAVLKSCQLPFEENVSREVPLEDKLLTGYLYFAEGTTSRTDLAHYANLPAEDVRVWTGGRVRLEISALPLDAHRSQLQVTAFIEGRVAPVGAYARAEQWVKTTSNGRLEDEVLRGLAGKLLGLDLS
jgi:hypothetical protein